jgi:sulfopyruvate decarboxylase TPP-binding subunit
MSLYLKSKPRWCPTAIATEQGWVNSLNGELLVSHRGLKSKIDAELPVGIKEEVIMQVQEEVKVELAPVQVEIKEETIKKPKKKQKLLGEVVEFDVSPDAKVIGE